jgi:hypothetical protein
MPVKPLDFDAVRKIASMLPDIHEGTGRGATSLKLRGKLLACPAVHKSAEPNSLVLMVGFDQRKEFLESDPDVFYVTDHYLRYPSVLVRLSRIRRDALRDFLGLAWRFISEQTRR